MILLSYLQIWKKVTSNAISPPLSPFFTRQNLSSGGGTYHDTQGIAIIEWGIVSRKYCFKMKAGKHTSI